tara:strand:- start:16 stop:498 length:483 start_codon:yes stop_codon:yes gene_type:complete
MEVIDNFLEESYFNKLVELLNNTEFGWYTTREISNPGETFGNLYYQTHIFYIDHEICSGFFDELRPLYKKLDVKALIRVKANLFPAKEKLSEHGWHTDYAYSNKTALLYINDTDGYTKFEDGTKVDSVKNRVLIFDSNRKHLSTNCTNDWSRLNININYF